MIRHITKDLYQIGMSIAGDSGFESICVYVILNNNNPIIIDTGSFIHRAEIMTALYEVLNDQSPEFVFLTHTEIPHTGNLSALLERWPAIKIVISNVIFPYSELPHWIPAEQLIKVKVGDKQSFAGRELQFSDAILKDQPGTQWIFDPLTGTLFTADAFGYLHPHNGEITSDNNFKQGIPEQWFRLYHQQAFAFLKWVDAEKLKTDLNKVFEKRDVKVIAPAHGSAIKSDISLYVQRVQSALIKICRNN